MGCRKGALRPWWGGLLSADRPGSGAGGGGWRLEAGGGGRGSGLPQAGAGFPGLLCWLCLREAPPSVLPQIPVVILIVLPEVWASGP